MILSKKIRLKPNKTQESLLWQSTRTARFIYNWTLGRQKENLVLIEKVGWIKTLEQLPMDRKYCNPRISFDGKYWYISVGLDVEKPIVELTDKSIEIDLGIKDLAICSTGKIYKNINKTKRVKKLKKTLNRFQKQVSRKYYKNNGGENRYQKSQNILKLEQKLRLIHRRISNIRANNLHRVTNEIVKTKPSKIVIED
ncbi:transposase [Cetobacterium sp.]|uniref:transposase n=1 Tax=Cetobacterium sp. TaxID=2071632 RepID=UPI003F3D6C72